MRNRRTVDDSMGEMIVRLYADRLGSDAIAKKIGRSPSTVLRVLYERGVTLRQTHNQGWSLEAVAEEIGRRYNAGESTKILAADYGTIASCITYTLQRQGIFLRHQRETSRLYDCDPSLFTERPLSPLGCYMCGLLATDGNVSQPYPNTFTTSIALQERDEKVLFAMKDALRYNGPLGKRYRGHDGRQDNTVLCINSEPLAKALMALGIVPNKTHTLKVSRLLSERVAFWLGAWDGDGTIGWHKHGPQTGFVSASRLFAEQCLKFCRTALPSYTTNIYEKPSSRKNQSQLFILHFAAWKAARLLKLLYGNPPMAIPRKLDLAKKAIAYYSL